MSSLLSPSSENMLSVSLLKGAVRGVALKAPRYPFLRLVRAL